MARFSVALSTALVFCLIGSTADAAEPSDSNVSQSALSAMGLGGMQSIDRAQSSEIRGQGSVVFGGSWSRTFITDGRDSATSGSVNGYYSRNRNLSVGGSFSFSNSTITPFIYAGGASFAGGF